MSTLRFGNCRLALASHQVWRGSTEVHLSPRAFDLLRWLVHSRPRAVSKAELLEQVWPGTFVSDGSLTVVIAEIRAALGESARRPKFVRTVHRFGYAFIAPVIEEPDEVAVSAWTFWLTWAKRDFYLVTGENVVGRDAKAQVRLPSPRVSRRHARIVVTDRTVTIADLGSKNGTHVNGKPVDRTRVLEDGDEVRIDPFELVFRVARPDASTDTTG
jgi:DNA-binding winged helix-turn-helix (wHTH) protein